MNIRKALAYLFQHSGISILKTSNLIAMNLYRETLEKNERKMNFFANIDKSDRVYDIWKSCQASTSQLGADLLLLKIFDFKQNGFFIECGAGDGKHLSNSFLLEKDFGWSGILVEPNRSFHSSLRRDRQVEIETKLLSSQSGEIFQFEEKLIGELSAISKYSKDYGKKSKNVYEVESISLFDLLSKYGAPKVIDYFSLDVEGHEYEILKDFDFSSYKFLFLSIEHNYQASREDIYKLMLKNGYERVFEEISLFDDFYIYNETPKR